MPTVVVDSTNARGQRAGGADTRGPGNGALGRPVSRKRDAIGRCTPMLHALHPLAVAGLIGGFSARFSCFLSRLGPLLPWVAHESRRQLRRVVHSETELWSGNARNLCVPNSWSRQPGTRSMGAQMSWISRGWRRRRWLSAAATSGKAELQGRGAQVVFPRLRRTCVPRRRDCCDRLSDEADRVDLFKSRWGQDWGLLQLAMALYLQTRLGPGH